MKEPKRRFYGTATVGEKGQVVIPVEARKEFGVKAGEKFLVFGMGNGALMLTKPEHFEKMAAIMAKKLEEIQKMTDEVKKS